MKEKHNPSQYKIMEIIHKLVKNNTEISEFKCPKEISNKLLKEAMFGPKWEKKNEFAKYDKHTAWYAFSCVFYNKNPFGFLTDKIKSPQGDPLSKNSESVSHPTTVSNVNTSRIMKTKAFKNKSKQTHDKNFSSEFLPPDPIKYKEIDKTIPVFEPIYLNKINQMGKIRKKSKSKSKSKSKNKSKNKNKNKKNKKRSKRLKRTKRMKKSKNNRGGGRRSSVIHLPLDAPGRESGPWFRAFGPGQGGQTLIRLYSLHDRVNPEPLRVWGSQLPAQRSEEGGNNWQYEMMDTFNWLIERRGIQGILSLQACDNTNSKHAHRRSCRWPGYPINGQQNHHQAIQDLLWLHISRLHNWQHNFIHNILIQDMTAGTVENWRQVNRHTRDELRNNRILIHCYAGYGRTGIILLYYAIRDYFFTDENTRNDLIRRLQMGFFGFGNDPEFYDWIVECANDAFKLDVRHTDSHEAQAAINEGDPRHSVEECTHRGRDAGAAHGRPPGFLSRLFITRINYILLMLWETIYSEGDEAVLGRMQMHNGSPWIVLYRLNDDGVFDGQATHVDDAPDLITQQYGFNWV